MNHDVLEDFRKQCERNLSLSVEERISDGFNYVYKPVLDDAPWRSFDSMAEYRQWCEENLPKYLGYARLDEWDQETLDHLTTQVAKREIDRRNQ